MLLFHDQQLMFGKMQNVENVLKQLKMFKNFEDPSESGLEDWLQWDKQAEWTEAESRGD